MPRSPMHGDEIAAGVLQSTAEVDGRAQALLGRVGMPKVEKTDFTGDGEVGAGVIGSVAGLRIGGEPGNILSLSN